MIYIGFDKINRGKHPNKVIKIWNFGDYEFFKWILSISSKSRIFLISKKLLEFLGQGI